MFTSSGAMLSKEDFVIHLTVHWFLAVQKNKQRNENIIRHKKFLKLYEFQIKKAVNIEYRINKDL